jgi:hypothetical protein
MASKQSNPNLPTQPAEIAESVYRSYKAGATIAALHARRPDELATCNADIYRQINSQIRARCDIIINNSTGGGSSGDMLTTRPDGMFENNFDERMKGLDARHGTGRHRADKLGAGSSRNGSRRFRGHGLQGHPGRTDHTGACAGNADRLVGQSSPGFWRSQ